MKTITTVKTMTLDGGMPCLDFVNSGYDREQGAVVERLHTYNDLLLLAERAGLFDAKTLQELRRLASKDAGQATAALLRARQVRAAFYQLFTLPAAQHTPPDLTAVNDLFRAALPYRVLVQAEEGICFQSNAAAAGLMAPVWQFVLSAYELIEWGNLPYVRQCQGCAWLFLDNTKNHRRKWCSMESCGNSHKTKAYYQRRKQSA